MKPPELDTAPGGPVALSKLLVDPPVFIGYDPGSPDGSFTAYSEKEDGRLINMGLMLEGEFQRVA